MTQTEDRVFLIDNDDTFDSVRNHLYDERIIEDAVSFSFVSKILDYPELVKPGVYRFKKQMTNLEAVRMLRSGEQFPVRITLNNIRLKEELSKKITASIGIASDAFLYLLEDESFLANYELTPDNVLSIFIPNTYQVYWTISAKALFERMLQEYNAFWNEERKQKAEALGLSPLEVSALAAIVQEESIMGEERPTIAGLYLNRLEKDMLLQADPTVKYAMGDFSITRVLTKYTQVDNPYNTYKYKGLPPGPISLPSINALEAVLNPEEHGYIYMCAKEDFSGYHRFAETWTEHNRNARLFQRALNNRKIYR